MIYTVTNVFPMFYFVGVAIFWRGSSHGCHSASSFPLHLASLTLTMWVEGERKETGMWIDKNGGGGLGMKLPALKAPIQHKVSQKNAKMEKA